MNIEVYRSHSFISELIRPDGVVFDFGMNDGGFSRLVAPRCRKIIGFEPDPNWNGKISIPDNVRVVPKALAARAGMMDFNVNSGLCSSLHYADKGARTVEIEAVTLDEALAEEPGGRIDCLKMDIEGEEVPVLLEANPELFPRVVQMTVEFHDFLDHTSVPAIRQVIAKLRALDFYVVCFSWKNYGDILFVNRNLVSLKLWQCAWLLGRFKYARGLGRIAGRWLKR